MKLTGLAATLAVALTLPVGALAQPVGIAAGSPGTLYYNEASAIAAAANAGGLDATVQSATSPNQYIPLVNAGGIQFGLANLQELIYAYQGDAWFKDRSNPNIRVVAEIMPLREALYVRADSGIKTIAELKGKPMVDGYTAQTTILPHLDAMYATAGLTRKDFTPVQVPSVVGGANAFMSGESAGFIFGIGAGKVREADAAVGGIRALAIDNTPENLAALRSHWPTAFLTKVEPGPNAPGVLEPGYFWAYPQVVFTNADVPDDVVYDLVKAIYENKEAMQKTFGPFALFNPDDMGGDVAPAEYHPGAVKFFKEHGLMKGGN